MHWAEPQEKGTRTLPPVERALLWLASNPFFLKMGKKKGGRGGIWDLTEGKGEVAGNGRV